MHIPTQRSGFVSNIAGLVTGELVAQVGPGAGGVIGEAFVAVFEVTTLSEGALGGA